jgi:hypothetical protein
MIRALCCAVLLSTLVALPRTAAAYGIFATGRAQDGTAAIAIITRPNEQAARAEALAVCERMARRRGGNLREPCRIVDTFQNRCLAAATGRRGTRVFHAEADTNYWARVRALDACRRAPVAIGVRSCSVVRSLCDTTIRR